MDTPNDLDALRAALDRILASLTRLGAPVVDQLRPGLTEEAITRAFRDLPFMPPRELRLLYAWRDGAPGPAFFFPSYDFLSLQEAIEDYHARRDVAEEFASGDLSVDDLWDKRWFPIFRASYGTEYVMLCPVGQTETAPILEVDVEGSSHDEEYLSLTHMMRVFADCFEIGAITLHPDGYLEEDDATVGDIRRTYAPVRAEEALKALQQEKDPALLNQAVNTMIELHETRAIEPLLTLLREGDSGARQMAIFPLGMLGDERAIAPLLEIVAIGATMRDADRGNLFAYALHVVDHQARMASLNRAQAIDALERIVARTGQALPVEPFLAAIDDPEPMVQLRAARQLGASGDVRALPVLLEALGNHNPQAGYAVIEALGQLGDARALEPLRRLARRPENELHTSLRQAALAAIARIEAAASHDTSG